MARYFSRYRASRRSWRNARGAATTRYYVETLFGRRLYLDINSRNQAQRADARRAAISAPCRAPPPTHHQARDDRGRRLNARPRRPRPHADAGADELVFELQGCGRGRRHNRRARAHVRGGGPVNAAGRRRSASGELGRGALSRALRRVSPPDGAGAGCRIRAGFRAQGVPAVLPHGSACGSGGLRWPPFAPGQAKWRSRSPQIPHARGAAVVSWGMGARCGAIDTAMPDPRAIGMHELAPRSRA